MAMIEVFDPPMCCSTGVCGPEPDARLATFAADLDWLKRQGVQVRRYNLTQEPAAFINQPEVARVLRETDGEGLPVLIIDDEVVSQGVYPSRQQLAQWTGLPSGSWELADQPATRPQPPSLSVVQPSGGCCSGGTADGKDCC
jgi:hypothetical protein